MDELLSIDVGSVRAFVRRWYGPWMESGGPRADAVRHLPDALADWHAVAASARVPITFQDHPIPISDVALEGDGMLPFWVENQNGYRWAVEVKAPGLPVYSQEWGSSGWAWAGEGIERFLVHCTVREAIIGAEQKFTAIVPDSLLVEALESFVSLPFVALASEEPETRVLVCGDALARLTVPPVGYDRAQERSWMLTVAAPDLSGIERHRARLGGDAAHDEGPFPEDVIDEPPPF